MKPEFEKLQNRPLNSFITRVVKRPKRPTLKEAWHFHPEVEICLTLKSEGKRFVGNDISDYQADDLVMLGANLPHGFITQLPSEQVVIQMQESFLGAAFLEKPEIKIIKEVFSRAKRGIQFFGETQQQVKLKTLQVLKQEGFPKLLALLDLLYFLAISTDYQYITKDSFQANTKMVELERVQVVYDYILKNYQEEVSLDKAANLLAMTKSSFCKFLKKHAKKTFSEIVNEIRIGHACDLMMQSDKLISTIAFESGYNDVSYFSRTFKKIMQTSPKLFIVKHRGGVVD